MATLTSGTPFFVAESIAQWKYRHFIRRNSKTRVRAYSPRVHTAYDGFYQSVSDFDRGQGKPHEAERKWNEGGGQLQRGEPKRTWKNPSTSDLLTSTQWHRPGNPLLIFARFGSRRMKFVASGLALTLRRFQLVQSEWLTSRRRWGRPHSGRKPDH